MSLGVVVNHWYERKLVERSLLGQVLRKCRRFYLGTFRPEYIEKAIAETRQGDCHRCGLCCELIYKCPFLGKDSQNLSYCRVYGDLRPANCRNYPFDSKDAEIDQCGYTFKSESPSVKAVAGQVDRPLLQSTAGDSFSNSTHQSARTAAQQSSGV